MEIFRAINLRPDYEYLIIFSRGTKWAVRTKSKKIVPVYSFRSTDEVFATIKSAKAYCTMEIQNPKWGNNYPKLKWEKMSQDDFERGNYASICELP